MSLPRPAVRGRLSFRARLVAGTALLVLSLVTVAGLLLHAILDQTAGDDVERVLTSRAAAVAAAVTSASHDAHRLTAPPGALDPGTALYDADGDLVAGGVAERGEDDAARLVAAVLADGRRAAGTSGAGDEDLRFRAVPAGTATAPGVVVVSEDTDPYERSEGYATASIVVLGLLTTAIAAVVADRTAVRALAPVGVMASRAADWSEHDLAHRFALGPPRDELTTLASTLDHLLDRVAAALRAEQRLTAELAHELRTPLTGIRGSAELALLRPGLEPELRADLEGIAASAEAMGEVVRTLLDLARTSGSRASCRLEDVAPRLAALVPADPAARVALELDLAGAAVAGPADVVLACLTPLVENALRHAASRVAVTTSSRPDGPVLMRVADDGPGVPAAVAERLFDPGTSGAGSTGLGLAIARRAARSLGGDVDLVPSEDGAVFEVRLPRG